MELTVRRILLTLLLSLGCVLPATAGETWVMRPTKASGGDLRSFDDYLRLIEGRLRSDGVNYAMFDGDDMSTAEFAAGSFTRGGVTRTATSLILVGFQANNSSAVPAVGDDWPSPSTSTVYPNWLTKRSRYWPSKPLLVVGVWRIPGGDVWTIAGPSADSCSTMVSPSALSLFSAQTADSYYRSNYVPGRPGAWKSRNGLNPLPLLTSSAARGSVRPLVQCAMSNLTWNTTTTVTDPDGMVRAASDSALMWRVSPVTATGAETGIPILYVWPTANGVANWSDGLFSMGVAALDSAARAVDATQPVIGSRSDWVPTEAALVISNAGRHSTGQAAETDAGGGVCSPTDTTVYVASVDSLHTLGAPISVQHQVDPDTLRAYPHELRWYLSRLPEARFMPYVSRGFLGSTVGVSGNTSRFALSDPLGRNRTRWMGDSVGTSTCIGDTSYYCGLRRVFALGDSVFGTRALRTLRAPVWDIVPFQYSRDAMPLPDSLHRVLRALGIRTVIVNPSLPEALPGSDYNTNSASGTQGATGTNIIGYSNNSARMPVWSLSSRARLGSMRYAATRAEGATELQSVNVVPLGHNWSDEFLVGNRRIGTASVWYATDYLFYRHNFRTPLDVFEMPASLFHGSSGANRRFAYWQFKWVVNQVNAENYFAGRTVRRLVYTDDL